MKRTVAICLSVAFVLCACAACGDTPGSEAGSSVPEVPLSYSASAESEADVVAFGANDSGSAVPVMPMYTEPVPDFLDTAGQDLYLRAKAAFSVFTMSNDGFGSSFDNEQSIEIDGVTYYLCDGQYTRWNEFEAAMLELFTPEYFEELNYGASYTDGDGVEHRRGHFIDVDGDLYTSGGDRGGDITFVELAGFELASQTDERIEFYVVGKYREFVEDEEGDWSQTGEITEEKRPLVMENTQDGWRFSLFSLAY